jgi:hypothetical protein
LDYLQPLFVDCSEHIFRCLTNYRDFDVMIQKENLDDQEKNIKINDLKLRGTHCLRR